jgi:hypothetical protein
LNLGVVLPDTEMGRRSHSLENLVVTRKASFVGYIHSPEDMVAALAYHIPDILKEIDLIEYIWAD